MQPYFLPYIGYWQLLNKVDKFIVYDNIQYTKKGWINRNRFLKNGKDALFTIPLKKDSDTLNISDRTIASTYDKDKLTSQFRNTYLRAPYFEDAFPVIEEVIHYNAENLFDYILNSIKKICSYLKIDDSKITASSSIPIDHTLKSEEKVLALCHAMEAKEYYNPIGGVALYDKVHFSNQNIDLKFLKALPIEYKQHNNEFVPWLSIVDIMMFSNLSSIQEMLTHFTLE
ncbi:WbqC family protein [Alkalimarinus coralli]|uniref:WbqC family protein n=1 Tax=Alkalimarinus coralli TaxID=2935863 RepID=UPI00202B3483|nr:WbqC family protein [Alkalimarinus coralli]